MTDSHDDSQKKDLQVSNYRSLYKILNLTWPIDILFGIFCLLMFIHYSIFISSIDVPMWDGAALLLNARQWLDNTSLSQPYRPPLLSWLTDAIWIFTGEDWTTMKYVQMIFTFAAIILLYIMLRRKKGALFAFGVSLLTFTNAQLFFYTAQIRTEGIALFFLILSLYFLEGTKKAHWVLSGISIGLTFMARYPILLQALVIFVVESFLKKDPKSTAKAVIAIISVILLVVVIIYAKTGTFEMALDKDSNFGGSLSSFTANAMPSWGPAILLLPVAFLFRSTYKDKFNYIFIVWFVISLLSRSSNSTDHQYIIQFMPAAYYLVILAIENIVKFDRKNIIFSKRSSEQA